MPTFGLGLWLDRDTETSLRFTRLAERLGFDWIWYPDHYFLKDVYAIQAAAALQTKKIRMGTAIASPFLRHPAALASAVATIDDLSKGRAALGLGSGGHEYPADLMLNIDMPLTACRETIEIARSLWKGESVDYDGRVFKVRHARLRYKINRKIPIYLGARGTGMLQLAGSMCDGTITHGVSKQFIKYVVDYVKKGATKAGRKLKSIDIQVYTPVVAMEDVDRAYKMAKPACILMVGGTHSGGKHSQQLLAMHGLADRELVRIRGAMNRGEFEKASSMINEEMVDSFCIVGTPERCVKKVKELESLGVTHITMELPEYPGHLKLSEKELESVIRGNAKHIVGYFKGM